MVNPIGSGGINGSILASITANQSASDLSLAKIASGNRLVTAGVDATANSIATQLQSDVAALSQSVNNVQMGANLVNSADGGLSTISDLITRGRELATQAANGTLNDAQRQSVNQEFNSVRAEIDRITSSAQFNGQPLLNGNLGAKSPNQVNVQVGAGAGPDNQINLNVIENTGSKSLGIDKLDISTAQGAGQAMSALVTAGNTVSSARGQIGAIGNRLSIASSNLGNMIQNLSSAQSELTGTDIAAEITNLQKSNTQTQMSLYALGAQNRLSSQTVGSLLNTSA
jgi:flagellin